MVTFLFVHGINVRGKHLDRTLDVIRRELSSRLPEASVLACSWGDDLGAKLHLNGASIPNYAVTRRGTASGLQEFDELIQWQMLYADPFFELNNFNFSQAKNHSPLPPSQLFPLKVFFDQVEAIAPSDALNDLLIQNELNEYFFPAITSLKSYNWKRDGFQSPQIVISILPRMVARCIVAEIIRLAQQDGIPAPQGKQRDMIVERIENALGGVTRGISDWFGGAAVGIMKTLSTRYMQRHRGTISDFISPIIGDVILYQTRGQAIRHRIQDAIIKSIGPVYIIAHSLGGVATIDTLLLNDGLWGRVEMIFTIGSQPGFFYELNALTGMEYPSKLPIEFPKWTNFFDKADLLSYLAAPSFGLNVLDIELNSNQPFPQSHSAYWHSDCMWDTIIGAVVS